MSREVWGILVANIVAALILVVFQRWRKDIFFGMLGIWLTVLPIVTAFFDGRMHIVVASAAVLGVFLVGASMAGKLPSVRKTPDNGKQPDS